MKISAVVLAKNEEKNIANCIKSLAFAREIIVIDNNSEDFTVTVSKKNKARVFVFKKPDFAAMRNFAKEKAKYDWLFYLDADEIASKPLAEEIKNTLKNPEFLAYWVPRINFYFGRIWPKAEQMLRLINKQALTEWYGVLHESPRVNSETGRLKNPIYHYTHQNLTGMVDKTNAWSEIEAELRFNSGHPPVVWWRFFRVMLTSFYDSYLCQSGFRKGTVGLIESIYQSFSMFITYAKLWEKQNQEKKS